MARVPQTMTAMPTTRSLDATRRNAFGRHASQPKRDPGAYIGRLPERAPEAAVPDVPGEDSRERALPPDDTRREAGENR